MGEEGKGGWKTGGVSERMRDSSAMSKPYGKSENPCVNLCESSCLGFSR